MSRLRAIVKNGRLVLDEPTGLPEGTVLDLVVDDEGDDLDEASRQALHQAIMLGMQQAERGQTRPAEQVLEELRTKRQ
jgi:hypothetical protein